MTEYVLTGMYKADLNQYKKTHKLSSTFLVCRSHSNWNERACLSWASKTLSPIHAGIQRSYKSAGVGSQGHLAMELIPTKEKMQFTHLPFKVSAET